MTPPAPNAKQLQAALRGALDTPTPSGAPGSDVDTFAEDLFLIAAGRGDELPAARRDELLEAVAIDPGIAALLQDAHTLAAEQHSTSHAGADNVAPPPPTFQFPRTAVRTVFALAACLTVALGVWRFADPPTTQVASGPAGLFDQPGMVVPSGVVGDPPADEINGTASTLATATSTRDSALIASLAFTAVLGLGLVLLTPGRKPDDTK